MAQHRRQEGYKSINKPERENSQGEIIEDTRHTNLKTVIRRATNKLKRENNQGEIIEDTRQTNTYMKRTGSNKLNFVDERTLRII